MKDIKIEYLSGNGSFDSDECVELLKECDVVVTNPPFSLFREYVALLIQYNKKFLIIGNMNAITYKEIFPYIKNNEIWLGVSKRSLDFILPNGNITNVNSIWFTNIDHKKRHQEIDLYKKYNSEDYPKYDNYNAIDVSKVCEIPMDYDGVMGVPITFLDKYCPTQFKIIGWSRHNDMNMDGGFWLGGKADATINGKEVYRRILIKKL